MKANQKFVQADEAVSPVIGVILMVAITVVLAAVVFVLVSDLGDTSDSAPQMSFSKNASQGTVTLVSAESGLTWDKFTVTPDGTCATAYDTGTADVTAGQVVFTGCVAGDAPTIVHKATNTLVYSTTF